MPLRVEGLEVQTEQTEALRQEGLEVLEACSEERRGWIAGRRAWRSLRLWSRLGPRLPFEPCCRRHGRRPTRSTRVRSRRSL